MEYRLLETGYKKAAWNMAVDEAVMTHVSSGKSPPTLRFYGWSPPSVSIGYFQSLEEEVDQTALKDLQIDVVRRMTGGGAVFHEHELTYSIIIPEDQIPNDILESYKLVCGAIVNGLEEMGMAAVFAPLNDIIVDGKKISGNAQTRRMHCMLQHGTILLKVNVDRMFTLLKVPSEKMRDKIISNVKERVTSVKDCLGKEASFQKTSLAMKNGFKKTLDIEFKEGQLTESELKLAEELIQTKYANDKWNKKR